MLCELLRNRLKVVLQNSRSLSTKHSQGLHECSVYSTARLSWRRCNDRSRDCGLRCSASSIQLQTRRFLRTSALVQKATNDKTTEGDTKASSGNTEDGEKTKEEDTKKYRWNDAALAVVLALVTVPVSREIVRVWFNDFQEDKQISYHMFLTQLLSKGEVEHLEVIENRPFSSDLIVRVYLQPGAVVHGETWRSDVPNTPYEFSVAGSAAEFEDRLRRAEIDLGVATSDFVRVGRVDAMANVWFLSLIIANVAMIMIMRRVRASSSMKQAAAASKSKKEMPDLFKMMSGQAKYKLVWGGQTKTPDIKFTDVAGLHEAKIEVSELVNYLRRPEDFTRLGAKLPSGALLLGPPGCGKTLLAKAVATESSVPFMAVNGTEFVEVIGGLGASRVRSLFAEAKTRAPCIIYIDELDAIGRKRTEGNAMQSNREEEQTLNQLLVEMDGMDSDKAILIIGSTNRADILDTALLRRGRFDRHITIDLPTLRERQEIFQLYLGKIKTHKQVIIGEVSQRLAEITAGFSGADIFNVVNEAAISAGTSHSSSVRLKDLDFAIEKILAGPEKRSRVMSDEEKKMVAYHECGHALVGWLLKHTEALMKVSIVPRASAAVGYAQYTPSDRKLHSKEELFDRMCMALGGRVAESLIFGRVSTGAEDDLKKVTKIAYDQVRVYGMSENIGALSFGGAATADDQRILDFRKKPYSKRLQTMIDMEASHMVGEAYTAVEKLLTENTEKLKLLAVDLLKNETLTYEDVRQLIGPPPYGDKRVVAIIDEVLPSSPVDSDNSSSKSTATLA